MSAALRTPDLTNPDLKKYRYPYVGGVWRNKAAAQSARISPRNVQCVLSATGASAMLAFFSSASLAQDPALIPGYLAPPAAAAPVAPTRELPATHGAAPAQGQVQAAQQSSSVKSDVKEWPPTIELLSPSARLNPKSKHGINLVHRWQERGVMPTLAERGAVHFIYGATQDTVVCAPLRLCDIELQAGEIVQNVNLGDPVMWSCPPAISGSGAAQITHLMCKPADAGLVSSLAIQTSRRTYSIELTSTRKNYMPRVSWSYPEDQAAQWAAYQQQSGSGGGSAAIPPEGVVRYTLSGDNPPWRPIEVYGDTRKTYIHFPPAMAYGKAPVLERLP